MFRAFQIAGAVGLLCCQVFAAGGAAMLNLLLDAMFVDGDFSKTSDSHFLYRDGGRNGNHSG